MRWVWLVVASMLASSTASTAWGMNFKATSRTTHKSLDCVVRRLERAKKQVKGEAKTDVVSSLYHLNPILDRYGGALNWNAVELGSEEEAEVICAQHGYARSAAEHGEILSDIKESIWRWVWKRIKTFLLDAIPWLPLVVWLWVKRKKIARMFSDTQEELRAYDAAVERAHPDKVQRSELFADPLVHRGHQKLKNST